MIAVDTNILVYSFDEAAAHHSRAAELMTGLAEGDQPWILFWQCLYEFVKVVTHPRVLRRPASVDQAVEAVEQFLDSPTVSVLGAGPAHRAHFRQAVLGGRSIGSRVHDAHIAALALEHDVREFWSADRDFRAFATLRVVNPFLGKRP